jgi:Spy/CpxP family protein refolding chaperone
MNKVTGFIFGAAALATIALVSAPMAAAPQGGASSGPPVAHRAPMGGRFAGGAPLISIALKHKTELNLTSEQVANLEKIKSHYESQVTPLRQQVQTVEKEIASLSEQSPANLIQIKSKVQDAEKFRSELRYLQIEALENGKTVLTAQQRDQLKTLVSSRQQNFRQMHKQPS